MRRWKSRFSEITVFLYSRRWRTHFWKLQKWFQSHSRPFKTGLLAHLLLLYSTAGPFGWECCSKDAIVGCGPLPAPWSWSQTCPTAWVIVLLLVNLIFRIGSRKFQNFSLWWNKFFQWKIQVRRALTVPYYSVLVLAKLQETCRNNRV